MFHKKIYKYLQLIDWLIGSGDDVRRYVMGPPGPPGPAGPAARGGSTANYDPQEVATYVFRIMNGK